jgi:[ribosomal protein S5]-alanine N-acetyltransferase
MEEEKSTIHSTIQNTEQKFQEPQIRTESLLIRLALPEDRAAITSFYISNKKYLEQYSGAINEKNFEEHFWINRVDEMHVHFSQDRACNFFLFKEDKQLIGYVNFSNFIRGSFQCCTLGYGLAQDVQGNGLMTEALSAAIPFAFNTLNFHRIEANYHPANEKSAAILKKLGFKEEGRAQEYLRIRGSWEPHIRTSLTNHNWIC